jgi:hypothetical protein
MTGTTVRDGQGYRVLRDGWWVGTVERGRDGRWSVCDLDGVEWYAFADVERARVAAARNLRDRSAP